MVRLNRIYTKAGDKGDTRLVGGQKVRKNSLRIESYGTVDELMSCIGVVRTAIIETPGPVDAATRAGLDETCRRIQNELFNLGSDLATLTEDRHPKQPLVEARHIQMLENELDGWNDALPELRSFVLPGGGRVGAFLHVARTVCRRAERCTISLSEHEPIGELVIPYLNRLSDHLFVMSRHVSRLWGEPEPLWQPETT